MQPQTVVTLRLDSNNLTRTCTEESRSEFPNVRTNIKNQCTWNDKRKEKLLAMLHLP